MRNIENGLTPESQPDLKPTWTPKERMNYCCIPDVSVAVISDYRLDWAQSYGVANAETETRVTADTVFQAASLTKAVSAASV